MTEDVRYCPHCDQRTDCTPEQREPTEWDRMMNIELPPLWRCDQCGNPVP